MTTTLLKPVIAAPKDNPTNPITIPVGARIEFHYTGPKSGLVKLRYRGRAYAVFLHDVLDACGGREVDRILG